MTRFLSSSLQAPEPFFRHGLRRLEQANGNPSTDIRLSSEVIHAAKAKLMELGLDPLDTTSKELFHALKERVKEDDKLLLNYLRTQAATHISAEADVVAGMAHVIKQLPESKQCFGLKSSSLRSIIKANPPKKAMKGMGYRSMDSFVKQESPALLMTAAWLTEGEGWQKRLLDQYKKLQPSDFETRSIQILHPTSAKWQKLSAKLIDSRRHNLVCFKELGALVFLPLPKDIPAGVTTVSFSQALHELNEIRASSSYLKLSQVKANFGDAVRTISTDEPHLSSELLDKPVPWHLIQRYYSRLGNGVKHEIFEPYIESEDMVWHPVEATLSKLHPRFAFWDNTSHLGFLDEQHPVSLNLVDIALNLCNNLPYEKRVVHYFQRSLWHELLMRYLHAEPVERTILNELQPQYAAEMVRA